VKCRAALSLAYGTGLRASEVTSLKVTDIDSGRMVISVEQGKGHKDRYAMLSEALLEFWRAWWLAARERGVMLPGGWLFPGQKPINPPHDPLTSRQLNRALHQAGCRNHIATAGVRQPLTKGVVGRGGRTASGIGTNSPWRPLAG
jgi:integrase